jgi:putative ABC transport system permease protein
MRKLRAFVSRVAALLTGRFHREFDEELQSHLAMLVDDNVRAGMSPAEARRQALLRLGGLDQTREIYRDRASLPIVDQLLQDVRIGVRMLRRNSLFTTVAVLTLGLGIGANAAIFSVVNAVLLRPLPFPEPDRLVLIWATNTKSGDTQDVASYPDVEDWKAQTRAFEGIAAFTSRGAMLTGAEQAELVPALQVMPGFFETLGIAPAIGRTFRAEEQDPGSRVTILSDGFWRRHFGGRLDILGQALRVNEESHTIIGVMPPDFRFSPDEPENVYTALARDPSRSHGFLRTVARLRRGVSRSAAQAEMESITQRIARAHPKTNQYVGANVIPLVDAMVGTVRNGLLICLGVVAIVLLIACTNVANLLLSRNASRQREIALRKALGAGRRRLTQQLLTESLLIALAGGAVGLFLASLTAPVLAALLADFPIPRLETTRTDGWVLAFTLAVSLGTALIFGSLHAVAAASGNLTENLRDAGRAASSGVRGRRIRNTLVVIETALALVLLAGAGSLLKTLLVMRGTAPGFTPANVMTVSFWLPKSKLSNASERLRFYESMIARVETIPGARASAVVANLPLGGGYDRLGFHVVGRPDPAPGTPFTANFNIVSPGYFNTLAIPVKAGREFTHADSAAAPRAIVINESAARRFWPDVSPLGRQITLDNAQLTVVGVTGDVRQMSLGTEPRPEIYLNYLQPTPNWPWLTMVVRTDGELASLAASLKTAAQSVDRNVPVAGMRTLDEVLSGSLAEPQVYTVLLGAFAALALALAAVGLYGVVSYSASQRTHEMGIRQALGAGRGDIVRLVLRQGLTLSIAGMFIGLLGGVALMRVLTSIVPTVRPGDPLTLAAVSALLMGVALAATFIPADRASRVDPLVALRYE